MCMVSNLVTVIISNLTRGYDRAIIGELDRVKDQQIKSENVRAEPLKPIVH